MNNVKHDVVLNQDNFFICYLIIPTTNHIFCRVLVIQNIELDVHVVVNVKARKQCHTQRTVCCTVIKL